MLWLDEKLICDVMCVDLLLWVVMLEVALIDVLWVAYMDLMFCKLQWMDKIYFEIWYRCMFRILGANLLLNCGPNFAEFGVSTHFIKCPIFWPGPNFGISPLYVVEQWKINFGMFVHENGGSQIRTLCTDFERKLLPWIIFSMLMIKLM